MNTLQEFFASIKGLVGENKNNMCKDGVIPTNIPIENLLAESRYYRHLRDYELDIVSGAFLLEDEQKIQNYEDIYKMSLKDILTILTGEDTSPAVA